MKRKTTFSLLCLMWMVLLSLGVFDVHANDCTSYYRDYQSKVEAYNTALQTIAAVAADLAKPTVDLVKAAISNNDLNTVNLLEQTIWEVESQRVLQTKVVQQRAENHKPEVRAY